MNWASGLELFDQNNDKTSKDHQLDQKQKNNHSDCLQLKLLTARVA
jgi:hypothetical protein